MEQKIKQAYLDVAEYLVAKDETMLAIKMLEMVPGRYRDQKVKELQELKNDIGAKLYTANDYVKNSEDDIKTDWDLAKIVLSLARGQVLHTLISEYNNAGTTPHIVDFGPGDFTIPIGLDRLGVKFTYHPVGLRPESEYKAKEILEHLWATYDISDRPTIFVAYEVIEHLHHVDEIRNTYDRIKGNKAHVLLSTPKYTYGEGNPNWRTRGCPHLRTYTPQEFLMQSMAMFPGHSWKFVDNEVMVLQGTKEGS